MASMDLLAWAKDSLLDLVPLTAVLLVGGGGLYFLNRRMVRRSAEIPAEGTFRRQLVLSILGVVFLVAVIISAPLNPDNTHDLIALFGVALTGVIALSSTTVASNAMAGVMLRIVRNFRRGDYIRAGDYLGRVTERGLLHTEIQNERSDLITLPNLYLVNNPVTVIRPSGTFISAQVSLGYDLQHDDLEDLIKVSRFREEPIELIALSACETAAGDDRAALGLAGIAIKAGARSALATMWLVDDIAAAQLSEEFYRNLGESGLSKAKALQRAQLSLLEDFGQPYIWAPFLLIGNWL